MQRNLVRKLDGAALKRFPLSISYDWWYLSRKTHDDSRFHPFVNGTFKKCKFSVALFDQLLHPNHNYFNSVSEVSLNSRLSFSNIPRPTY